MNLLQTLKVEIASLGMINKIQIAKYVYIRTGQLFNYDPYWCFGDSKQKKMIRNKHIDINDVRDFNVVCVSWAQIYNDLLNSLGISSSVKYKTEKKYDEVKKCYYESIIHAYVEIYEENKFYKADITGLLQDFISIKFGYETNYNCQSSKLHSEDKYKYIGDVDGALKITDGKKLLNKLKFKLNQISLKKKITLEDYVYEVYKVLEELDFSNNVGFVIGNVYIETLLKIFIPSSYNFDIDNFFDNNKGIFITVHKVKIGETVKYFSYEKKNEVYNFLEISEETYNLYETIYKKQKDEFKEYSEKIVGKILKK